MEAFSLILALLMMLTGAVTGAAVVYVLLRRRYVAVEQDFDAVSARLSDVSALLRERAGLPDLPGPPGLPPQPGIAAPPPGQERARDRPARGFRTRGRRRDACGRDRASGCVRMRQ